MMQNTLSVLLSSAPNSLLNISINYLLVSKNMRSKAQSANEKLNQYNYTHLTKHCADSS